VFSSSFDGQRLQVVTSMVAPAPIGIRINVNYDFSKCSQSELEGMFSDAGPGVPSPVHPLILRRPAGESVGCKSFKSTASTATTTTSASAQSSLSSLTANNTIGAQLTASSAAPFSDRGSRGIDQNGVIGVAVSVYVHLFGQLVLWLVIN